MDFWKDFLLLWIWLAHLLHQSGIVDILGYSHFAEIFKGIIVINDRLWFRFRIILGDDSAAFDETMEISFFFADANS
jgi:hypothetical protein